MSHSAETLKQMLSDLQKDNDRLREEKRQLSAAVKELQNQIFRLHAGSATSDHTTDRTTTEPPR